MVKENYSIPAKNLLDGLINDYSKSLKKFQIDNINLRKLKNIKCNINGKKRKIKDLADVKNNRMLNQFRLVVYNADYINNVEEELDKNSLNSQINGQFILVDKPVLKFNQLMAIVDHIEKARNSFLMKCAKAKLEPIVRVKHALENDFIDFKTSLETSKNCQKIFKEKEKETYMITEKKIEDILGKDLYAKYKND